MFKNQKGISLIQVTIAAGMLGGLALVSTQLLNNMKSGQVGVEASSDEMSLRWEVQTILNNEDFCRVSLAGLGPIGTPDTPVIFKKDEHDGENDTDGLDIKLYLAQKNNAGLESRNLKFTTHLDDAVKGQYGKIKIEDIYLRFNNGQGFNYPDNPGHIDIAELTMIIEKKLSLTSSQQKILKFPVNVFMSTSSDDTTILGCGKISSPGASKKLIAVHSQTTTIPDCPTGWDSIWDGYSLLMAVGGGSSAVLTDLGKTSSCMEEFRFQVFNECSGTQCDYQTGDDYTYWLSVSGTNYSNSPSVITNLNRTSRCRVCSGSSSEVFTKHSQTSTVPTCPSGFTPLWSGYSFGVSVGGGNGASSSDLNSPGSCLKEIYPRNFIECHHNGCESGTSGDYTYWLSTRGNIGDTGPVGNSLLIKNLTSRCTVCASN